MNALEELFNLADTVWSAHLRPNGPYFFVCEGRNIEGAWFVSLVPEDANPALRALCPHIKDIWIVEPYKYSEKCPSFMGGKILVAKLDRECYRAIRMHSSPEIVVDVEDLLANLPAGCVRRKGIVKEEEQYAIPLPNGGGAWGFITYFEGSNTAIVDILLKPKSFFNYYMLKYILSHTPINKHAPEPVKYFISPGYGTIEVYVEVLLRNPPSMQKESMQKRPPIEHKRSSKPPTQPAPSERWIRYRKYGY